MKHELIKLWEEYKNKLKEKYGKTIKPKGENFPDFMEWMSKEGEKCGVNGCFAPDGHIHHPERGIGLPIEKKESWEKRFDDQFVLDGLWNPINIYRDGGRSHIEKIKSFIREEVKKAYMKGHTDGFEGHYNNMEK